MEDTGLKMKRSIKAYSDDGNIVAEFFSVRRAGDKLVIDSRALGVMRMDMTLPREEIVRMIGIVFSWAVISYVLLMPFFLVRSLFRRDQRSVK